MVFFVSNSVGNKIKKIIIENEITQKDLAKLSGLSANTISRYVNNERKPNTEALEKIASALGTNVEYLVSDSLVDFNIFSALGAINPLLMCSSAIVGLGTISALSKKKIEMDKHNKETEEKKFKKIQSQIKKFKMMTTGIIMAALTENSIGFNTCTKRDKQIEDEPDLKVFIDDQIINEWWFVYWDRKLLQDSSIKFGDDDLAKYLISKFMFTLPDKKRKSTIVVNDEKLYDEIKGYQNAISYKGNLSVALLNIEEGSILKEIGISYFDEKMKVPMLCQNEGGITNESN